MEIRTKLEGNRICLKPLDESNASEEYCSWLNDPEVNKYLETRKATIEDLKKYIESKNADKKVLFLGIFLKENNRHIGNVKLEPIDLESKKATLGILIGDKNCWGKGLGTEAVRTLLDYAFEQLGLGKIDLGVDSKNEVAINIYKKAGFKAHKTEKRTHNQTSQVFDTIKMSLKKSDYCLGGN